MLKSSCRFLCRLSQSLHAEEPMDPAYTTPWSVLDWRGGERTLVKEIPVVH